MVYFELEDVLDQETGDVIGKRKVEKPFINKWMNGKRMGPIYLKDKSQRYYYKYFGMYPKPELCPPVARMLQQLGRALPCTGCRWSSSLPR